MTDFQEVIFREELMNYSAVAPRLKKLDFLKFTPSYHFMYLENLLLRNFHHYLLFLMNLNFQFEYHHFVMILFEAMIMFQYFEVMLLEE